MADRAREAWVEAGTEEAMLPSGVEVGLVLPTLAELIRAGVFSGQLRAAAMRAAAEPESDESRAQSQAATAALIVRAVRRIRAPVGDLEPDGPWQAWKARHLSVLLRVFPVRSRQRMTPWEPFRLTVADLDVDEPRIPPVDREALERLVLHVQTPAMVDTLSRLARELITREEAQAVLDREATRGLDAWRPFRPERSGVAHRPLGAHLGHGPVAAARDHRSDRGLRGQRGAGDPAAPAAGPGQAG